MLEKLMLAHRRFVLNMQRIDRLMNVAVAKDKTFMTYTGANADIMRAIVVFLHATVEDLIRTQVQSSFTFSGRSDIEKAIKKLGRNAEPLRRLYNPLVQLAKRRIQIVHYGDMPEDSSDPIADWGIADVWCIIQWFIAVNAFAYVLFEVLSQPNEGFSRKYNAMFKTMDEHVAYGKLLSNPPDGDLDAKRRFLNQMSDQLSLVQASLYAWHEKK